MKELNQKEYLLQVKNAMILHFRRKDVSTTLKDINQLFSSGREFGKSEREICDDLGNPKDFVEEMLQGHSSRQAVGQVIVWIITGLVLSALIAHALVTRNLFWGCILSAALPVYIWYMCGGYCLQEFPCGQATAGTTAKILNLLGLAIVIIQQIFVLMMRDISKIIHMSLFKNILFASRYISLAFFTVLMFQLLWVIYKLGSGHYRFIVPLFFSVGIMFSILFYVSFIVNYSSGSDVYLCSMPCIINAVLSILFLRLFIPTNASIF